MYEHLASFGGGPPNSYHLNLYSQWAKNGWGMIITGNVMIFDDHLSLGRDLILPPSLAINSEIALRFKRLADVIHGINSDNGEHQRGNINETLAIMQLNHGGRQSAIYYRWSIPFSKAFSTKPNSADPRGLVTTIRVLNGALFQIPKTMSQSDINEVIDRFVEGAIFAYRCGFDGVQLHAAHGCE